MDIVYERERASAQEVLDALPDPPTYSAVRALLRTLVDKGQLVIQQDGPRYVYLPTRPREQAAVSALRQVVRTFFGGSVTGVVATLLNDDEVGLDAEQRDELLKLVEEARAAEEK